jgi:hypothetical protein
VCLRPSDFDAVVRRLGLQVMPGERDEGDQIIRFRRTIVESNPSLPFFIDWEGAEKEMDSRYGAAASTKGVVWVEIGGDEEAIRTWIGDDTVPVRVVSGPRGPQRFALRTNSGSEIILE